jgi:hypothetical protein
MKGMKYIVWSMMGAAVLFAALYSIPSTLYPAHASDDSSASADILKQLQTEAASMAAKIKNEVTKRLDNKEYSGLVTGKTDTKITLDSNGNKKDVLINQYTVAVAQGKISSKLSSGDFLIALGDVNDSSELVAKKIIKMAPPKEATPSSAWGKVKAIGPTGITITSKDAKPININVDSDTTYQLGKDDAQLSDVLTGHNIIAVGDYDQNRELLAKFIYLIPGDGLTSPKSKVASGSADASMSGSQSAAAKKK